MIIANCDKLNTYFERNSCVQAVLFIGTLRIQINRCCKYFIKKIDIFLIKKLKNNNKYYTVQKALGGVIAMTNYSITLKYKYKYVHLKQQIFHYQNQYKIELDANVYCWLVMESKKVNRWPKRKKKIEKVV